MTPPTDMDKLEQAVVIYMPASINENPEGGFKCGSCIMGISDTEQCTILDPPEVDLNYGVCALYIPGRNLKTAQLKKSVSKEVAGYTEEGPTYCGICEYFQSPNACEKVEGEIDKFGCCNAWETE